MGTEAEARCRRALLEHLRSAKYPRQCRCGWVPARRCPQRLAALTALIKDGLLAEDAGR